MSKSTATTIKFTSETNINTFEQFIGDQQLQQEIDQNQQQQQQHIQLQQQHQEPEQHQSPQQQLNGPQQNELSPLAQLDTYELFVACLDR